MVTGRSRSTTCETVTVLLRERLHLIESGYEFGNRIVEKELALLVQHHHGRAGDRLGHRRHAEDGVRLHRLPGVQILKAEPFEVSQLAAPHDRDVNASELLPLDRTLEYLVNALQP